jgi:hypothetical protein
MENAGQDEKKELSNIENELNKILELYDKKKIIIIPNTEKIDNNINDSNKEKKNKLQNKNTSDKKEANSKFNYNIEYSRKEFKRPDHYIIYSEKNRLENSKREYEATDTDINFIPQFVENSIKVEDLEKIICLLENDIGTGEQIPPERVKELIKENFPKYEEYIEKISNYFYTRREIFKKSLLRKYWKEQKSTDKYITTTFRRRDREKMKTRKNKQNESESLDKIKDVKNLLNTYILQILTLMNQKEDLNKLRIKIKDYIFKCEISNLKREKLPKQIEDSWKKDQDVLKEIQNSIDKQKEEYIPPKNIKEHNSQISESESTSPISSVVENEKIKKQKEKVSKTKTGHKINIDSNNTSLQKIFELPEPEKSDDDENNLKLRIRYNRSNMIVVDRYIQNNKSFNPFNDSFNKEILKLKNYDEDLILDVNKERNFDNFYTKFLKKSIQNFYLFSDSDSDNDNFQNQLKNFQSSHKQFLRQKREHS